MKENFVYIYFFDARDLDSKVRFSGGDVEDSDTLSFHFIVTRYRNEHIIIKKNFTKADMQIARLPDLISLSSADLYGVPAGWSQPNHL